jgi:thiamine-phosphate pyrophosphorylase
MILPRVYPIVDTAEWIAQLGPVGVRLVQLRLKGQPQVTVAAQIRRAQGLCASFGIQLIVNDHWQLALAAGCDFVHLGQGDLEGADLGALRRAGVRLGISTHDEHELERALALAPDYVALGPIYHTTLKIMPWAPQGLARLGQWRRRVGALPLVAIGGVTLARLPEVLAAGADVAAVVSDILGAQDPPARARQWLDVAAA